MNTRINQHRTICVLTFLVLLPLSICCRAQQHISRNQPKATSYLDGMIANSNSIAEVFRDIDLLGHQGNQKSFDWGTRLAGDISHLRRLVKEGKNLKYPPKLSRVAFTYNAGLSELDTGMILMPKALRDNSSAELREAYSHVDKCNDYIETAATQMVLLYQKKQIGTNHTSV